MKTTNAPRTIRRSLWGRRIGLHNYYRSAYESSPNRLADRTYEDVRPAYHLGQIAAQNPDYAHKEWKDVQSDLQRGWSSEQARKYGDWQTVSGFASEGYNRGRLQFGSAVTGTGPMKSNEYEQSVTGNEGTPRT